MANAIEKTCREAAKPWARRAERRQARRDEARPGRTARGGSSRTRRLAVVAIAAAALALASGDGAAIEPARTVTPEEWARWSGRFLAADGRVLDRENGMTTHSEGQGYGMLLALAAGDRAAFDRIWRFTRERMDGRADRLVSWLWDPHRMPRIADRNNASDGDILIAYALVKAAIAWGEKAYLAAADAIVADIGRLLVRRHAGKVVLRPAAFGFDPGQHVDGPVVNLSYYVYGAFPLFAVLRPEFPWAELVRDGLAMQDAARRNALGLAPDWITLRPGRAYRPARGHDPHASYDAVRIPLYMLMEGDVPRHFLRPYDRRWNRAGDGVPVAYDLKRGRAVGPMADPGYRMIAALVACALRDAPIPADLRDFRPTTYFASTLHLLALSVARAHHAACLAPPGARRVAASAPTAAPRDVVRR